MNLTTLKTICAAFHQKLPADLTIGGVDMFLNAANLARKGAEQLHSFEYSRVTAELDIDGEKGRKTS